MKHPPADELTRVRSGEASQAGRLRRNLSELARLPQSTPTAEPRAGLNPITRLEAVLVEATIERMCAARFALHNSNPVKSSTTPLAPSREMIRPRHLRGATPLTPLRSTAIVMTWATIPARLANSPATLRRERNTPALDAA
jgi:hypothetical protein